MGVSIEMVSLLPNVVGLLWWGKLLHIYMVIGTIWKREI